MFAGYKFASAVTCAFGGRRRWWTRQDPVTARPVRSSVRGPAMLAWREFGVAARTRRAPDRRALTGAARPCSAGAGGRRAQDAAVWGHARAGGSNSTSSNVTPARDLAWARFEHSPVRMRGAVVASTVLGRCDHAGRSWQVTAPAGTSGAWSEVEGPGGGGPELNRYSDASAMTTSPYRQYPKAYTTPACCCPRNHLSPAAKAAAVIRSLIGRPRRGGARSSDRGGRAKRTVQPALAVELDGSFGLVPYRCTPAAAAEASRQRLAVVVQQRSSTTSPSSIRTIRLARCARARSCVTITIACPVA